MSYQDLPTLNACLNTITTVFLVLGFVAIKKGNKELHKKWMLAAVTTSILFLTSYVIYHAQVGSVKYPHHDWTRPLYFTILIPHVLLAMVMCPMVVATLWHAFRGTFPKHKAIARWTWPVWIFVSISGVLVYLMLYKL